MKHLFLLLAILLISIPSLSLASDAQWRDPDSITNSQSAPPLVSKKAVMPYNEESTDIDIELIDSELKARNAKEDKSLPNEKYKKKVPQITKPKAGVSEISEVEVSNPSTNIELATFAGGCFWCMEQPFDDIDGVISTTAGYTGGESKNPTYEEVSSGRSGHYEAVQIAYDPNKVSYAELLKTYWKNVDPTNGNGQFCDIGPQYKPVIFYHNEEQKEAVYKSMQDVQDIGFTQSLKVEMLPLKTFHPAEEYHQDYYKKNPLLFSVYKQRCGREKRLHDVWREKDLEKKLPNNVQ